MSNARRGIMALEELDTAVSDRPIVEQDMLIDNGEEELQLTAELVKSTDAIIVDNTLDGVVTALESMEVIQINHHAGKALMLAVEQICKIDVGDTTKHTFPAFEEFSTKRQKRLVSQESLQSIKDFGKKILTMIINAINKAIEWFKKIFNKQAWKNKANANKAQANKDKLKIVLQKKEAVKEKDIRGEFIIRVLHRNGKVPQGIDLIREANNHFKLMKDLDYTFETSERLVLKNLSEALKSIHKEGKEFQDKINDCQSEICTSSIGNRISDRTIDTSQGFAMFEKALTFGDKSFYRTGIIGPAEVNVGDIKAYVGDSTNAKEELDFSAELKALDINDIESLNSIIVSRITRQKLLIDSRDKIDFKLSDLRKEIIRIQNTKAYEERTIRRAKVLYHVINMYLVLRNGTDVAVMNYDQKVCEALLTYVEKSL